jgi:uncharacterized membrane protein
MLINFLNTVYTRFISPSPFLFKLVNWFCNICLFVGAIQELFEIFSITLPEPYNILATKTFLFSAGFVRIMSGMTVKKPTKQDEQNR